MSSTRSIRYDLRQRGCQQVLCSADDRRLDIINMLTHSLNILKTNSEQYACSVLSFTITFIHKSVTVIVISCTSDIDNYLCDYLCVVRIFVPPFAFVLKRRTIRDMFFDKILVYNCQLSLMPPPPPTQRS